MADASTPRLAPPSRWALLKEGRAALDLARMTLPLLAPRVGPLAATPRRILVLPGFSADDRSTWPLRRFLRKHGHVVDPWGLGRNLAGLDIPHDPAQLSPGWRIEQRPNYRGEAGVPALCDRMVERMRGLYRPGEQRYTLIGWSLGGVVAREVARDLPDHVEHVITLGTPVLGGPKYTAARTSFERLGMDLDWIEAEVIKRDVRRIAVPITAIVSHSDGIVAEAAAYDRISPRVRHIRVDVAHVGLCFNPSIWKLVLQALAQGA